MIAEPAPVTPTAVSISSRDQNAPYQNLAALRQAHLDLREHAGSMAALDVAGTIRSFLATARMTGAILHDPGERRAAQSILNYWNAELAGNPGAQKEDFVPVVLAAPDAVQTFNQLDQAVPEITASKIDQRGLVRLSALARQWRDSQKQPGYLLAGETIAEAMRFEGQDPNLDEFIQASQRVVDVRRRNSAIVYLSIAAVIIGVAAAAFGGLFGIILVKASGRFMFQWATKDADPATALRRLDLLQPLQPPYDLSGTPKFANVVLPGLRLYAPNFSGVTFSKVEFPKATLPAATFSGASFSFDGGGRNDFGGANLRQAQFRGAKIANTSFNGADLYRASFDRAVLCDVDFTGANLRAASFWAVTLNESTKNTLKISPWWQALGWPWSEIEELAPPRQGGAANAVEDERLKGILKSSTGFKDDIQRPIDSFNRSSVGTIERALALNDLAWTDAVWGVDITEPKNGNAIANSESSSDPCSASDLPANARRAAQQAVCIVDRLNREESQKGSFTALASNLRDTLAYVLMQSNAMPEAMATFGKIAEEDAKSLEEPETSFRYAIAQYATGADKAAAIKRFQAAIEAGQYQPSHELQTLKDYIFPVPEFVDALRNASNRLWPTVARQTSCPAANPPAAPR